MTIVSILVGHFVGDCRGLAPTAHNRSEVRYEGADLGGREVGRVVVVPRVFAREEGAIPVFHSALPLLLRANRLHERTCVWVKSGGTRVAIADLR